jgi:hypothetical protein
MISCHAYSQDTSHQQLSEDELDTRLLYLTNKLEKSRRHNYLWQHGWEGIYGISSLTQASLAISADNSDDEVRYGVGAFKSAFALGAMLMNPIPTNGDLEKSSNFKYESASKLTKQQKIQKLKQTEALFKQHLVRAESIHTWSRHGSAILFNLATAGLVSAFGNDKDAIASAIGGILASEINIWTQPSQVRQDWKNYQNLKTNNTWSWYLQPTFNGLAISINF